MGRIVIIRGLPGSGKSCLGHALAALSGALFIEPDMALVADGEYRYAPMEYLAAEVVSRRLGRCWASLGADVIYADVLPRRVDVERVASALCAKAMPLVVTIRCGFPESVALNVHRVDPDDILKMERRFQEWPGGLEVPIVTPDSAMEAAGDVADALYLRRKGAEK